jgi:chaperone required for assembly of F1-ATPase
MRRFYTDVAVTQELGITLDGRPVRTPARAALILPNAALAEAIAVEWADQGEQIDPRSMPITGLANAAIDRVAPDPVGFTDPLCAYAETELLCYRATDPPELVQRQAAIWGPLLDWAQGRYDVRFVTVEGIMHQPQPPATLAHMRGVVEACDAFTLAALNPLITISGSLVIALAVMEQHIEANAAFDAAHLDALWQEELWGVDDLAISLRDAHRRDFLAADRFLGILRQFG